MDIIVVFPMLSRLLVKSAKIYIFQYSLDPHVDRPVLLTQKPWGGGNLPPGISQLPDEIEA